MQLMFATNTIQILKNKLLEETVNRDMLTNGLTMNDSSPVSMLNEQLANKSVC